MVRDGLVLACQRKSTMRYPLKWEFPGGKVEPGERPEQTVFRELYEELGNHRGRRVPDPPPGVGLQRGLRPTRAVTALTVSSISWSPNSPANQ